MALQRRADILQHRPGRGGLVRRQVGARGQVEPARPGRRQLGQKAGGKLVDRVRRGAVEQRIGGARGGRGEAAAQRQGMGVAVAPHRLPLAPHLLEAPELLAQPGRRLVFPVLFHLALFSQQRLAPPGAPAPARKRKAAVGRADRAQPAAPAPAQRFETRLALLLVGVGRFQNRHGRRRRRRRGRGTEQTGHGILHKRRPAAGRRTGAAGVGSRKDGETPVACGRRTSGVDGPDIGRGNRRVKEKNSKKGKKFAPNDPVRLCGPFP